MFNINFKSVLKISLDKLANRVSTLNNNTNSNNSNNNTNKTNNNVANNKEAEDISDLKLHIDLKENWELISNNNLKLNLLAQEMSTKFFLLNHTQLQFKSQSSKFIEELNSLPSLIIELNNTILNMIKIQDKLSSLDKLIDWIENEEKSIRFEDWKLDKQTELNSFFELTRKSYNEKMDLLNSQLLSNYNINQSTLNSILPKTSDFPHPTPMPSSTTSIYNASSSSENPIQQSKLDLESFYSDIPSPDNLTSKPSNNQLNSKNYSFNFNTGENSENDNNLIAQDEDYPE